MKKTNFVLRTLFYGPRRIYENEFGEDVVKLNGQVVSVKNPSLVWSQYEYLPYNRQIATKKEET